MLIIDNTKSTNQLVVNAKDINLSGTNTYLLRFKNNQTQVEYYTLSVDESTSNRYSLFNVVSDTNNPYSSSVYLPVEGYYTYYVYESSNSGSVSSSLGLNLVDKGKLLVSGSSPIIQAYTGSNAVTFFVYTGSQS